MYQRKETDYKTVGNFAKEYVAKNNKKGVNRGYIYLLIKKEIEFPGTSGIDVMEIDGVYFVRYSGSKRLNTC
jgi:hypothetical protein